jgi:hypothetical protein
MGLPGFSDAIENNSISIFCNKSNAPSWYVRDEEADSNTVVPSRLKCRILSIDFWEVKEGKYAGNPKAAFKVVAGGQQYSLRTAPGTAFYKGLVGAIAMAPAGTFLKEVTVSVRDGEAALLCNVYDGNGEWLAGYKDWKSQDWDAITAKAIAALTGVDVETVEEDCGDFEYVADEAEAIAVDEDLKAKAAAIEPKPKAAKKVTKEDAALADIPF